jgi:excisionase family DNA binding protein
VACAFYTPQDVAKILNLSADMVYDMLREEQLPAVRLGGGKRQLWRIPMREFHLYLETLRSGPRFDASEERAGGPESGAKR